MVTSQAYSMKRSCSLHICVLRPFLFFLHLLIVLPLYSSSPAVHGFTENKGQVQDLHRNTNTTVRFFYSYGGFKILLHDNHFSYEISSLQEKESFSEAAPPDDRKMKSGYIHEQYLSRIDVRFIGANPCPAIIREEILPGVFHYYNTPTPVLHVCSYRKITYKNLYPGIDLEFSIHNDRPKYNFILHPGADIRKIRMVYEGAEDLSVNPGGVLQIPLKQGTLSEFIPESFQKEDLTSVEVKYCLEKGVIGFRTKAFNKSATLVIDPVPEMIWGRGIGGGPFVMDQGTAVARDSKNNILATGTTGSPNFATSGAHQTQSPVSWDAFVVKLDSSGKLLWATYYGGEKGESGQDLAIDTEDNILIAGTTSSYTGIATPNACQPKLAGLDDAFIASFDSSGILLWGSYYGGESYEEVYAMALDKDGFIIITGTTESTTAMASPGCYQSTVKGSVGFLARFNPHGVRDWGTYFGGPSTICSGVDTDSKNNIVITGQTSSHSIASPYSYKRNISGSNDAFVAKFSPGGMRIWATFYGGSGSENSQGVFHDINTDSKDNIIIAGCTNSPDGIATPGVYMEHIAGNLDAFVAKWDSNGALLWGTYFGGESKDQATRLAIDAEDNIVFTGLTYSRNGIATSCSYQPNIADAPCCMGDAFLAKFSPSGNRIWSTYHGNIFSDAGLGVAILKDTTIILTGYRFPVEVSFPPPDLSPNYYTTYHGAVFIGKFRDKSIPSIKAAGRVTLCPGDSVALSTTAKGEKYIWSTGDSSRSIIVKQEGSYHLTITDSLGCTLNSKDIQVNYLRPVVSPVTGSSLLCIGDSLKLTLPPSLSYLWSTGDTTQSVTIHKEGDYSAETRDTSGCLSTSKPIHVFGVSPPEVSLGRDAILCPGSAKEITLHIPDATFLWNNGSTDSTFSISRAGEYTVQVTRAPCPPGKATVSIQYAFETNLEIYNLITPNNDGLNDSFQIGNLAPGIKVQIFNRWGAAVYQSSSYNNDWYPYNLKPGVYYYQISIAGDTCVQEYKGWLEIIGETER